MPDSQSLRDAVKQIFSEYLTSKGMRRTPERFAILEAVYSIDHHFEIEYLYSLMLSDSRFHVSRATIYNTMVLLMDARLVVRNQFGGTAQYEKCYKRENHHHLICTQCGKVIEFQNEAIQNAIMGARYSRFSMSQYSLSVYGLCSKCERLNRKKKK